MELVHSPSFKSLPSAKACAACEYIRHGLIESGHIGQSQTRNSRFRNKELAGGVAAFGEPPAKPALQT